MEEFSGYAIIEMMGHRQLIGHVQATTLAGKSLLKVDVLTGENGATRQQFIPAESLYCMTPVSEAEAKAAAARIRNPFAGIEVPQLPSHSTDEEEPAQSGGNDAVLDSLVMILEGQRRDGEEGVLATLRRLIDNQAADADHPSLVGTDLAVTYDGGACWALFAKAELRAVFFGSRDALNERVLEDLDVAPAYLEEQCSVVFAKPAACTEEEGIKVLARTFNVEEGEWGHGIDEAGRDVGFGRRSTSGEMPTRGVVDIARACLDIAKTMLDGEGFALAGSTAKRRLAGLLKAAAPPPDMMGVLEDLSRWLVAASVDLGGEANVPEEIARAALRWSSKLAPEIGLEDDQVREITAALAIQVRAAFGCPQSPSWLQQEKADEAAAEENEVAIHGDPSSAPLSDWLDTPF